MVLGRGLTDHTMTVRPMPCYWGARSDRPLVSGHIGRVAAIKPALAVQCTVSYAKVCEFVKS